MSFTIPIDIDDDDNEEGEGIATPVRSVASLDSIQNRGDFDIQMDFIAFSTNI